jgi:hypothetical protein
MAEPFILVEQDTGRRTWINAAHVTYVEDEGKFATVYLSGRDRITVRGSAEDLVARIQAALGGTALAMPGPQGAPVTMQMDNDGGESRG